MVISRKLPLPVEMLESISYAHGTNARGKKVQRACCRRCASPFLFFSFSTSLSFFLCFYPATQPAGNEILVRPKPADRSINFVSDRRVSLILPLDRTRNNSRETLNVNRKNQVICIFSFGDRFILSFKRSKHFLILMSSY